MTCNIIPLDCRIALPCLIEPKSIHTCVTSPPYFGLRDYDHADQIGLEQTPEEYIAQLVDVFRAVRGALRDDGTLWLNIGDSYAGSGKGGNPPDSRHQKQATNADSLSAGCLYGTGRTAGEAAVTNVTRKTFDGIKAKDLIGIPWRVALALQADGWYLRQDIIWSKPNPMPESVTDRCTKAHEYIFLLSKSPRYYFDVEAVKEPASYPLGAGNKKETSRYVIAAKTDPSMRTKAGLASIGARETRNRRSVWTVTTKPYKGAHFATFPPDLIEPCILAGAPAGGTVLDPFAGSGTTGMVAERLGRNSVLCELNPKYIPLIEARLASVRP